MTDANLRVEPLCIEPAHPCLPGHFPGHPVVPGVVLLDRVASLLDRWQGRRLARIAMVKFIAPLLPGEQAELEVALDGAQVRFRITRAGATILRGEAELA